MMLIMVANLSVLFFLPSSMEKKAGVNTMAKLEICKNYVLQQSKAIIITNLKCSNFLSLSTIRNWK